MGPSTSGPGRTATAEHVDAVIAALAGPGARARADQVRAVEALVDERRRVLVVQATGWGKSAVYWAATTALRAGGGGPTLVVSPLLALMRDQVDAAARAGLAAATVNSTNTADWDAALAELDGDRLDVLLVSPERLANPAFAGRLRRIARRCGLVVIDEAHCISDWGFDFRPDYQRLSAVLLGLAPGTPVLATTATANSRVTADVAAQLGEDCLVLRGTLARASLRLAVVGQLSPLDRYAWLSEAIPAQAGSGIVYALTVAETERVAAFLRSCAIDAVAYNGSLDAGARLHIEDRLRSNSVKVVVATSALGMGYDKPDLAFVVHLGSPASPVAYYQQVGRAGRALDEAMAVLLPSAADERIWAYFATSSIPDPDLAAAVLAVLDRHGPATLVGLEQATGGRRTRLETLLKILAVDGAVWRTPDGWEATGQGWQFDTAKYAELLAVRSEEADLMRRYASGAGCLMEFLQTALDDPSPGPCGRCSVCTGQLPFPGPSPSREAAQQVRTFLRGLDTVLEPRKLWPSGVAGRKGKLPPVITEGRAVAFGDDPAWADVVGPLEASDGPLSAELVAGVSAVLARWRAGWTGQDSVRGKDSVRSKDSVPGQDGVRSQATGGELPTDVVAVVAVPSRRRPQRVRSLAEVVAAALGVDVVEALSASGPPPPQDAASAARAGALLNGLHAEPLPRRGAVVLVDDTYRSGWTMTVAGVLLAEAGATEVRPLVLHRLP